MNTPAIEQPQNLETISRELDAPWHWQAELQLELRATNRGSRLSRCRHNGPLYVQKPFYPEGKDYAHIYLLHPPGGLVSGDRLSISLDVKEGAHGVVTTPGAARMYRARTDSPIQRQDIHLSLGEQTSLEWFPMETIVYDGAAGEVNTTIELAQSSQLMAWEITCLGLPASQQLMERGHFCQNYRIVKNNRPIFIDRLNYQADKPGLFHHPSGMRGATVSGFFIAGSIDASVQESLLEQLRDYIRQQQLDDLIAVTLLEDFCMTRYLGHSANQARDGFSGIWEILRPMILQRSACHPRIWLT